MSAVIAVVPDSLPTGRNVQLEYLRNLGRIRALDFVAKIKGLTSSGITDSLLESIVASASAARARADMPPHLPFVASGASRMTHRVS